MERSESSAQIRAAMASPISVVVPVGWNYLLNPAHPDARRVRTQRIEYRPDVRLW